MLIDLQDNSLRGLDLTEEQVLLDLAIGLFVDQRVTLGRGAEIARLSQSEFLRQLGERGIPVHYDVEDFQADMKVLKARKAR